MVRCMHAQLIMKLHNQKKEQQVLESTPKRCLMLNSVHNREIASCHRTDGSHKTEPSSLAGSSNACWFVDLPCAPGTHLLACALHTACLPSLQGKRSTSCEPEFIHEGTVYLICLRSQHTVYSPRLQDMGSTCHKPESVTSALIALFTGT